MICKVKRRLIALIGGLILCVVLFCTYIYFTSRQHHTDIEIDVAVIAPYLKDGDIICRMGDRIWSAFIGKLSSDEKRFSHIGIVRIRDDSISIINAEVLTPNRSESVNETSLADFLVLAKAVGVYRANFIDGAALSDKATEYLGRPFDWNFDLEDDTKIYCTELVYLAIKHTAPEYTPKAVHISMYKRPILMPNFVVNSPHFDEVLYVTVAQFSPKIHIFFKIPYIPAKT
jgi:hypothetical protein